MTPKPILVIRTQKWLSPDEFREIKEVLGNEYYILFCKSNNGTDSFKVLSGRTPKRIVDRIIKECKKLEL